MEETRRRQEIRLEEEREERAQQKAEVDKRRREEILSKCLQHLSLA